ncbi:MAG: hypothetical protein P8188_05630 [Gemmatimonadota bacterium]
MNLMRVFPGRGNEPAPDEQVSAWLGEIDPGRDSATYWMRFHHETVKAASFELARRRRDAQRTVTGVVSSWSRAVVSAALVAAAAAGVLMVQPAAEFGDSPALVEDVLLLGMTESAQDEFVVEEEAGENGVRFISDVF